MIKNIVLGFLRLLSTEEVKEIVLGFAKDLVKRTDTKVDDTIVEVIEIVLTEADSDKG